MNDAEPKPTPAPWGFWTIVGANLLAFLCLGVMFRMSSPTEASVMVFFASVVHGLVALLGGLGILLFGTRKQTGAALVLSALLVVVIGGSYCLSTFTLDVR
ncbi:MAG: hypothetical protein AAFN13_13410 [Bacteroidota bacterium]